MREVEARSVVKVASTPSKSAPKRDNTVRKTRTAIEKSEAEIAALEAELAAWEGNDYKKYEETKQLLDNKMHEWEKLNYELELLQNE